MIFLTHSVNFKYYWSLL